jgi:uncharacterized glyoxalase superfamily protein PhnB
MGNEQPEAERKPEEKHFIRPVIRVRDVAASIAYYCDKLGCVTRWQHPEGKPIIAEVERGDLAIILDSESVVQKPSGSSVITLSVEPETLEALHREFMDRGANITTAPFPVVWQANTYQFDVEDRDGNILVFRSDKP